MFCKTFPGRIKSVSRLRWSAFLGLIGATFCVLVTGCGDSSQPPNTSPPGDTTKNDADSTQSDTAAGTPPKKFASFEEQQEYEKKVVAKWREKHGLSEEEFFELGNAWIFRTNSRVLQFASVGMQHEFVKRFDTKTPDVIRKEFPPVKEPEWYTPSFATFMPEWRKMDSDDLVFEIQLMLPGVKKLLGVRGALVFKEKGKPLHTAEFAVSAYTMEYPLIQATEATAVRILFDENNESHKTLRSSDELELEFDLREVTDADGSVRSFPPTKTAG